MVVIRDLLAATLKQNFTPMYFDYIDSMHEDRRPKTIDRKNKEDTGSIRM